MKASATGMYEEHKTQTACDLCLYKVLIEFLVNYTERETKKSIQACRILLQLDRFFLNLIFMAVIIFIYKLNIYPYWATDDYNFMSNTILALLRKISPSRQ